MIKLIAIDIDGTLLTSQGEVSEETRKAITYAKEKGAQIVLASGRIASSVRDIAQDLGADHYFISGNGAMTYDIFQNEVMYENVMDKKKILELVRLCEENSIFYNIYTQEMVLAKSLLYNVAFYHYENSKKNAENKTNINIVQEMEEYIKNLGTDQFLKMTICDDNQVVFGSIIRKLKQISNIDVLEVAHMSRKQIRSGTEKIPIEYFYTEITKKGVNKWNAIQNIMDKENISKEEVLAIRR